MIYINKTNGITTVTSFYNNELLHRIGGPAVIEGEYRAWWFEGKLHRLDGPAVVYDISKNGLFNEAYYIDDIELTDFDYHKLKNMGNNMITIKTNIIYFSNKEEESHRLNGPAVINNGSYRTWCKNGKLHRLNGPAIIIVDYQEWWIEGVKYTETGYNEKLKEMGLG